MRVAFVIGCLAAASLARGGILEKQIMDGDKDPITNLAIKIAGGTSSADHGKVLLDVTLSGPGVTTANDRAWLYGDAHAPRLLHREGDPLPGFPSEKIGLGTATIGPTGWYGLNLHNLPYTASSTVIGNADASHLIVRRGDPAPGTSLNFLSAIPRAVVSEKQYTLLGYLDHTSNPNAFYRTRSDGSLQHMANTMEAMPQLLPENRSQLILPKAIYAANHALWTLAYLSPNYAYGSSQQALFMSRDSGHALVVKDTDPQPVSVPIGANHPTPLWLGANGAFTFHSGFLTSDNRFAGIGMYAGTEDSYQLLRVPNTVFTDQPGNYVFAIPQHDSNSAGLTALLAGTDTEDLDDPRSIIGRGTAAGGFQTLAITKSSAPGMPGVQFDAFHVANKPSQVWINDVGEVAFYATLAGAGIDETNDRSIWLYDRNGALNPLVREGDLFTSDGITRTVATIGTTGQTEYFHDDGRLMLMLSFTDDTRGYFAVTVPEPAAALSAPIGLGLLLAQRRRPRPSARGNGKPRCEKLKSHQRAYRCATRRFFPSVRTCRAGRVSGRQSFGLRY